jgi:hypothetical protein
MNRNSAPLLIALVVGTSGCVGEPDEQITPPPPPPEETPPPPGSTTGGEGNTFDHDNDAIDPFELIDRIQQEGPPSFTARMHGCVKPRYRTIGDILSSRGVNLADTTATPPSAGYLYANGRNAMGGSNLAARIRENIEVTTSATSRLFDIFVAAAPEVIANLATSSACPGAQLFDPSNNCMPDGVSCLLGYPATANHLLLCNETITGPNAASTVDRGKQLAVALLLAAAHTCE